MANNNSTNLIINDEQHLIVDIISRLPVESVLCCRCVCKSWRALLYDPYFTQMHTDRTLQQQQLLLLDDDEQHPWHSSSTSSPPVSILNLVYFPNNNLISEVHLEDYYIKYADDQVCINNNKKKKKKIWRCSSRYHKVSRPLNPGPPLLRTGIRIGANCASWLILGSCNGLICFYNDNIFTADSYIIYNPITKEYVHLRGDDESRLINNKNAYYYHFAYGFGYHHSSTKDYKIVKIIYQLHHKTNTPTHYGGYWRVQIYTLGSGGKWRIKKQKDDRKNMCQPFFHPATYRGVYVNGALYWVTGVFPETISIDSAAEDLEENVKTKTHIISFDLADEKLKIIPSPPPRSSSDVRLGLPLNLCNVLGVLERHLCLFQHATLYTDIWVMNHNNNNYGGDDQYRWRKMFSIPLPNPCTQYEPIGLTKRGAVLCFRDNSYLISYDPRTKTLESMGKVCLFDARTSYTKSFVSLKALGEENAEIVKSFVARRRRS